MTKIRSRPPIDRFGMRTPTEPSPTSGSANARPVEGWVPIRDLHARHRRRILAHLLDLDERDRYLRFGYKATTEQIQQYVASIDFKRDEVFGIFNSKLHLVAVAHLAAMPGKGPAGDGSSRGRAMEFGVSVLPAGRGKGLGLRLFVHAMMHARNQHASHMMIHALSENGPMLRIAAKAGAVIERDGPDAEAWLKLPPDTVGTHIDSSLQSIAAGSSSWPPSASRAWSNRMWARSSRCSLASSFLTRACSGLSSSTGLTSGAAWPACLSRRARWPLISPSSVTRQAGESTRRVVMRTSLARSASAVFRRSSKGLKASAASSACFFSASSCSEPRSTAPLVTLCSCLPSNSCRCESSHSSTRSVSSSTSMPFFLKSSSCGLFLAAARVSAVMT